MFFLRNNFLNKQLTLLWRHCCFIGYKWHISFFSIFKHTYFYVLIFFFNTTSLFFLLLKKGFCLCSLDFGHTNDVRLSLYVFFYIQVGFFSFRLFLVHRILNKIISSSYCKNKTNISLKKTKQYILVNRPIFISISYYWYL